MSGLEQLRAIFDGGGVRFSEECCIRKAVNERGLNSGPVGLADAISEDECRDGHSFCFNVD